METLYMFQYKGQTVYFHSSENMSEIPNESITLVITSPPYWNVRDYGGEQIGFRQKYEEYIASLNRVWDECIKKLQPNGKLAINLQPLPIAAEESGFKRRTIKDIMVDVQNHLFQKGLFLSGMHYWDKAPYINNVAWGSYPKPTNIHSNTSFEQIYVFVKPGTTRILPKNIDPSDLLTKDEWRHWAVRCIWDDIAPVIKINTKGENIYGHGAPFPEEIPYRIIRMHSLKDEMVLDPFLGSGTTLKICRLLGRQGIGYEINASYQEKIKSRIDEEWTPPPIDDMYLIFGANKIDQILHQTIDVILNHEKKDLIPENIDKSQKTILYRKILNTLVKQNLITRATMKRLLHENESDSN
jgi:DNA modification methylase